MAQEMTGSGWGRLQHKEYIKEDGAMESEWWRPCFGRRGLL